MMTNIGNALSDNVMRVREALMLRGMTATATDIMAAAAAIMSAEDDWYWSSALLSADADLRRLAARKRREAIDKASEQLFALAQAGAEEGEGRITHARDQGGPER